MKEEGGREKREATETRATIRAIPGEIEVKVAADGKGRDEAARTTKQSRKGALETKSVKHKQ